MSEGLYVSCADVLSVCQPVKDDLAALLDPETGFAPRMRQICWDQIAELDDSPGLTVEIELLRLEYNTWSLLQALMPARKTDPPRSQSPKDLLIENPYTPTATLAQAIIQALPLLQELFIVRDWLHETAPTPAPPEANNGYWKFTKHTIMNSLRTGQSPRDGIVTGMDPDVLSRYPGTGLASDDANYEKSLVQALYAYVRAGRLEDAVDACRRAHQPWRAASLRGSLLFQWRGISTASQDVDLSDEEEEEEEFSQDAWSGNRMRRIWKGTCIRAALNPTLSEAERTLYAAIAPSPYSIQTLKNACKTWEDHLWAELSLICEEKETKELSSLGGSFWEGGVDAVEKGVTEVGEKDQEAEEDVWEMDVKDTLDKLASVSVTEGPPADHAFHMAQLSIILGKTDSLLDSFAAGLQSSQFSKESTEYTIMCRFFAHLILFLQMIDIPTPPQPTQIILESYLAVLEDAGQRDLIAMYAGALGDNAVERYAEFLVSLALSADLSQRRLALSQANEHGLDVERVAICTAERSVDKAFQALPSVKAQTEVPSLTHRQYPPTEDELFLLRSIEWTTFLETTYATALEQVNVMLRYFLCMGRTNLSQTLLATLPSSLSNISEPEETATEYLHYRQFFTIWELFESVVDCEARGASLQAHAQSQAPATSKQQRLAWIKEYQALIEQVYDQIVKLLTTEWLVSDVDTPGADRRRQDLILIRQIYIPELIIRLHSLLFSSRKVVPENLKKALELVNVVADSRYKLYDDFMGERGGGRKLSDYLGAVRQSVLGGLEHGGSDPFRVLHAA